MATFNALALNKKPTMQSAYGNVSVAYDKVSMPIGTAAADTSDVLRLPKNARIIDYWEMHDGGNSAATTANIGLAAVPGGPTTYVDADYFGAAVDLNAAAKTRWTNTAVYPVVLDGDYFVRITIAGTTSATAAMDIWIFVMYEFLGNL